MPSSVVVVVLDIRGAPVVITLIMARQQKVLMFPIIFYRLLCHCPGDFILFFCFQHHIRIGYHGERPGDPDDPAEFPAENGHQSFPTQLGHLRLTSRRLLHRKSIMARNWIFRPQHVPRSTIAKTKMFTLAMMRSIRGHCSAVLSYIPQ